MRAVAGGLLRAMRGRIRKYWETYFQIDLCKANLNGVMTGTTTALPARRMKKADLEGRLVLHPEARLSGAERELILNWSKKERRRLLLAQRK